MYLQFTDEKEIVRGL